MTKYILHGGETKTPNIHNKNFYREMFASARDKQILVCYFSRPLKEWSYLLESDTERIKKATRQKEIEIVVASMDIKKFLSQLKDSEMIYFRGGETEKLMKKLEGIKGELKKTFQNKTVLGSSAGALFLAKYFYDQDSQKIERGLGILPVKIMTHYLATGRYAPMSGKEKLKLLKNYKEKIPVYAIKETEFEVVEG